MLSVNSPAVSPDQQKEILLALEPTVQELIEYHLEKATRWTAHDIVPWEKGQSFVDLPWAPEQSPLRPEIMTALETNLLTEDNLPYYHATIAAQVPAHGAFAEWNRIWTSEEALHATVIRDYVHLMRAMDPVQLENNRMTVMRAGFPRTFPNAIEIFVYTSAQELATRISHQSVGQKSEEPVLQKILSLIARDENFHHIFYRALVKELLNIAPELTLRAMKNQLYGFDMPGAMMPEFAQRSKIFVKERLFGALEYRDNVVKPLLNFWAIDKLTGLTSEGVRFQDRILNLERVLDRVVDRELRDISHSAPEVHA